jgi:hypothetical protein
MMVAEFIALYKFLTKMYRSLLMLKHTPSLNIILVFFHILLQPIYMKLCRKVLHNLIVFA